MKKLTPIQILKKENRKLKQETRELKKSLESAESEIKNLRRLFVSKDKEENKSREALSQPWVSTQNEDTSIFDRWRK